MKSIQKMFRNPASDALLMLGFVISCIIIINISDLVSKISIEDQSTDVFKHHLVVGVMGETSPEHLQHLVELIDNIPEGNAFYNTYVTIERQADTYGAELVMQDNESLLFSFKEGGYDKKMSYTNAVIIGETFEKYVVTENGQKVIYFDRNRYEVIGVLENHMVAEIDKSLYIFWDTLEESLKAYHLQNNRMSFPYFKSNLDAFTAVDSLSAEMAGKGVQLMRMDPRYEGAEENQWYRLYNGLILGIGLTFSVFTCFSVSHLWLLKRKQELAIRVAYGYSKDQILLLLLRDIARLMVPTMLLAIVVQLIYKLIIGESLMFGQNFFMQLLVISAGILCIILLNVMYISFKMRKFSIAMINSEK